MPSTISGRVLLPSNDGFEQLHKKMEAGWVFQKTRLTNEYSFDTFQAERGEKSEILLALKASGKIVFPASADQTKLEPGDTLISFGEPPGPPR